MRLGAEILLALVVAWTLGGVLLRLGGTVLASVGAAGLALRGGATGLLLVGVGAALWGLGQAHHLVRRGECRSPLVRLILEGRERSGPMAPAAIGTPTAVARPNPGPAHSPPARRRRRRRG